MPGSVVDNPMITVVATILFVVLAAAPGAAMAGAESGFGLYLESADLVTTDADSDEEYARATFGGGFDYQVALGESFSLGISFGETVGNASFPTLPKVSTHKISTAALEARLWLDSLFVGYHTGTFVLITGEGLGSPEISGGASGDGFTLGVEGESGWFILAQTVQVSGLKVPDGPKVNIEGYRVRFGHRWR